MIPPVVHCIVPVRNRCDITLKFVHSILAQDYDAVQIYVVDDGSTDRTRQELDEISDKRLTVLLGDGDLWWGGAIEMGMNAVLKRGASENDYVLIMNDDVTFGAAFVSGLLSKAAPNTIVAAIEVDEKGRRIGGGFSIDYYKTTIEPVIPFENDVVVDSLPGRGVIIPVAALHRHGVLSTKLFKHYVADLSFFAKMKEKGCHLVVTPSVSYVTSGPVSDSVAQKKGFLSRRFSFKSKNNVVHKLKFFRNHGPYKFRRFSMLRYFVFRVIRAQTMAAKNN